MSYNELIIGLIAAVLVIVSYFLCKFLKKLADKFSGSVKSEKERNMIERIYEIIHDCVVATNQEYVESLKASGTFDMEAQIKAFNDTKEAIMQLLSTEMVTFITDTYNDLNVYLDNKIEAEVNFNK